MTIDEAKRDLLVTMASMDKNKLSLPDLHLYAQILRTVADISSKTYMECLADTFALGTLGTKPATVSDLQ